MGFGRTVLAPKPVITITNTRKMVELRIQDMMLNTYINFGEPYAVAMPEDLWHFFRPVGDPAVAADITTEYGGFHIIRDDRLKPNQMAMWVWNSPHGYSEQLLAEFTDKYRTSDDVDPDALWAAGGDLPGPFPELLAAWAKEDAPDDVATAAPRTLDDVLHDLQGALENFPREGWSPKLTEEVQRALDMIKKRKL